MTEDQHALRAVECRTVFVAFLHVRRPDSLFKNHLFAAPRFVCEGVLANRILRVRKLLIIVKIVFLTEARHAAWMRINTKSPQRDVDIVNTVIANVATAKVIPPPPDTGQQIGTPWNNGCRPQPCVKI